MTQYYYYCGNEQDMIVKDVDGKCYAISEDAFPAETKEFHDALYSAPERVAGITKNPYFNLILAAEFCARTAEKILDMIIERADELEWTATDATIENNRILHQTITEF